MKTEIPEQYRKGFTPFLNCKIDLSKKTFIPRPETAYWVKGVIKEINQKTAKQRQRTRILDIFAGSGCIGVAILKNTQNTKVDFIDIERRAIEQIKINLKLNKILTKRYRVYQSDIFQQLENKKSNVKYHYILANPPYAATSRKAEVQKSVLEYEPKKALFSGKEGLNHIKKFLRQARNHLKPKGVILMEFDPLQKNQIRIILKTLKYNKYRFYKDQFKKYRFVKIYNLI